MGDVVHLLGSVVLTDTRLAGQRGCVVLCCYCLGGAREELWRGKVRVQSRDTSGGLSSKYRVKVKKKRKVNIFLEF